MPWWWLMGAIITGVSAIAGGTVLLLRLYDRKKIDAVELGGGLSIGSVALSVLSFVWPALLVILGAVGAGYWIYNKFLKPEEDSK